MKTNIPYEDLHIGDTIQEGDECWEFGTGPWGPVPPTKHGQTYKLGYNHIRRPFLRAGERYMTRSGEVVELYADTPHGVHPWGFHMDSGFRAVLSDGRGNFNPYDHTPQPDDIIARMLKPDEVIREGDEVKWYQAWIPWAGGEGRVVEDTPSEYYPVGYYRRPNPAFKQTPALADSDDDFWGSPDALRDELQQVREAWDKDHKKMKRKLDEQEDFIQKEHVASWERVQEALGACVLGERRSLCDRAVDAIKLSHRRGGIIEQLEEQFRDQRAEIASLRNKVTDLEKACVPISVGRPIIETLAREGVWVSESGAFLVAADCLFKKNPYETVRYRILSPGDITEEGDEFRELDGSWHPFPVPHMEICRSTPAIRRRIS